MERRDGTCDTLKTPLHDSTNRRGEMCYSKLSFVTVLSPVRAVKGKGQGYGACLTCFRCREHDRCGKKQDPPVHLSREHPTELDACRSCENDCMIRVVMANALKLLLSKLLMIPGNCCCESRYNKCATGNDVVRAGQNSRKNRK